MLTRRRFLIGGLGLIAAPAVVRFESLMPVRGLAAERVVTACGGNNILSVEMFARECVRLFDESQKMLGVWEGRQ